MALTVTRSQVLGWWWTDKKILNTQSANAAPEASTSSEVITTVRAQILNLKGKFVSADGLSVNYAAMSISEALLAYENTLGLLHRVDLSPASESERKSFFINTYNSLVIHALAHSNMSEYGVLSKWDSMKFYATYSYIIGNQAYCINDIENGILRCNKQSPVPCTSPPFTKGDARLALVVGCDPRIHFALNCGAKSCPPIAVYSSDHDTLEKELTMATEQFLDATVKVEVASRVVRLSKIFEWYRIDFGNTDQEVLQWIRDHSSAHLQGQLDRLCTTGVESGRPTTIKYDPYDWSHNT